MKNMKNDQFYRQKRLHESRNKILIFLSGIFFVDEHNSHLTKILIIKNKHFESHITEFETKKLKNGVLCGL